jgi:hypothetical protein
MDRDDEGDGYRDIAQQQCNNRMTKEQQERSNSVTTV